MRHLFGQGADAIRRNPGDGLGPVRRAPGDLLAQQLQRRRDRSAIRQVVVPIERRVRAVAPGGYCALGRHVPPPAVEWSVGVDWIGIRVGHEQAIFGVAALHPHELRAVGVLRGEVAVEAAGAQQFMRQRQQQRAVGSGANGNPFVGDRRVAGAYRVDGDEAPACALEPGEGNFHRVAVMVFGGADHHEQARPFQIGTAELPETPAHGVDHAGGHVHRTEPAMRCIVGRAELAGEQAGERLHLVAPGEQRELSRIGGAQMPQTVFEQLQRVVPGDRLELPLPAFASRLAPQGMGQPRRGHLFHDARRALGANHAPVEGMVGIAFDEPHLTVAQMHLDAAAAGAHIAGRGLDLALAGGWSDRIVQRRAVGKHMIDDAGQCGHGGLACPGIRQTPGALALKCDRYPKLTKIT
ncbi:hypothetical protein GALL_474420 [mine drainage metagenome]|uniref:Uncharacterized protein n=1 Tax=mine drainage metagenome TaxID=410659 RepID=A0A1J5PHL2_9ZZZZ